MNGTFQLIRRARRASCALRPAQTFDATAGISHIRTAAPDQITQSRAAEENVHTGSIYRELMQKHDRMGTRHLQ